MNEPRSKVPTDLARIATDPHGLAQMGRIDTEQMRRWLDAYYPHGNHLSVQYTEALTTIDALTAEVAVQVQANHHLLGALRAIAADGCRSPSSRRADEWICLDDFPDVPEEWCAGCIAFLVAGHG